MKKTGKFFIAFLQLAGPFWFSGKRLENLVLLLALIVLTLGQIAISVTITVWSADLFDSLEQRSMSRLLTQTGLIVLIFAFNIVITTAHLQIKRRLQLNWRGWLSDQLISQWMFAGRHYLVTHMPGEHDNPDGRIAEDIRIATEYAIDLLHSLFYSLILLISFVDILWTLSGTVTLDLGLLAIGIPGHLVLIALAYAATASSLALWMGRPLTLATDHRQTMEANFRFALVKASENSQSIALIRGEEHETPHFRALFDQIASAWQQQTRAWSRIIMFSSGYSVLSMAFPILVAAPRYILGSITLGTLMQSAQAFQQMVSALSWPVDNMGKVAEWQASVERVLGLSQALVDLEQEIVRPGSARILLTHHPEPVLQFDQLCITRLDGALCVKALNQQIQQGERILLTGNPSHCIKLFKAIAGLWPWGKGRILLPAGQTLFFMPPRPYLPTGSLRHAICYPLHGDQFSDRKLQENLRLAGVKDLIPLLDQSDDWEKTLLREQQQSLGLVRLLLQKPQWIFMQEPFDSLDPDTQMRFMRLIEQKLPKSSVIGLTNQPSIQALFGREIKLT